jgi:DNA-binding PadR family transcriptional regulator
MVEDVRLSRQTLKVLQELLATASEWRYGYDLSRETSLQSGTLYPILVRLADCKWLEARWELPKENGKPRHMYRLTVDGRRMARAALREADVRLRALDLADSRS